MAEFNALQDTAFQTTIDSLEALKTQVEAWRDLAQQWAEEAEDVEVTAGAYSAKHHALKADAHRIAAELAEVAAEAAQLAAETAETNAETAQAAAEAAQTAASLAQSIAESEAADAETARIAAQAAQSAAEAAQAAAESARDASQAAKVASETARDKAQDWAEEAEDVEVETGKYSSLHHAAKSDASRIAAEAARDLAQQYRDSASNFADLAESYANYAGIWSNLSGPLNVPASVFHNDTFWMLLDDLADVTTSEPTGANPDWAAIGASVVSVNGQTGTVVIEITDISGLQAELDSKSDDNHTHTEIDITNLDKYTQAEVDAALAGKSDTGHTHTESEITDLDKYTQVEADALLAGKSNTGHDHDDLYYRQGLVDSFLDSKADASDLTAHENASADPHDSNLIAPVNKSGGWTFALADFSKNEAHYRCTSATNVNATAPQDSAQAIPVGAIVYITSGGAGIVTVVAGAGATVNAFDGGVKTSGQYDTIAVKKVSANTWEVIGGVA